MFSYWIRRPEPCSYDNCGSSRFRVGGDGYTYCDQGHQQSERGAAIAEDTGEYVIYGSKSRKRDSDGESATSRASSFTGTRAFEHYLLCVQLVLRKQLRWLIDVQKFPEELETLVKDLWALRLQRLQSRTKYESETETEAQSSQVFSSQSENEAGTDSQSSQRRRAKDPKTKEASPRLIETIALCYIGSLLLRIPVTIADIHKWMNNGELLYYRAHREVPLEMREHLPGEYERHLEPQELLEPNALHKCVLHIVTVFRTECGMACPPINTSLVLFRWIKHLTLPLEIFVASQRLARLLDVDFAFNASNIHVVLRYPEPRLMAYVVVATKLLLPFDDNIRSPQAITDLSTLSMNWDVWSKEHEHRHERDEGRPSHGAPLTFAQAHSFTELDCLEAADETLDSYLAWCADNVALEEPRERGSVGKDANFRKALFTMFPYDREPQQILNEQRGGAEAETDLKLRRVQEMRSLRPIVEPALGDEETRRPGSLYRRFRRVEDLSGPVKLFFEEAANLAGLSLDELVQAVFLTERKLQRAEEALRKAAKS